MAFLTPKNDRSDRTEISTLIFPTCHNIAVRAAVQLPSSQSENRNFGPISEIASLCRFGMWEQCIHSCTFMYFHQGGGAWNVADLGLSCTTSVQGADAGCRTFMHFDGGGGLSDGYSITMICKHENPCIGVLAVMAA